MQIKQLPTEFLEALPILEQIKRSGFEAYFVGGSVRDTLLGLPIHDVDIATSAYPEEVKSIFKKTVDTGIEHGTVMILDHGNGYEVTTFRTESGYQDYRRPDQVTFVRSLVEDLKRRDFTINALAMDETGTIIDKFGGLEDLDNQLIKAVGDANERFNEDALRMMRAVRFASQLSFAISPDTLEGIKQNAQLLKKIAVERIHMEFVKMMMGQSASLGLKLTVETNMANNLPSLSNQIENLNKISKLKFLLLNEVQVWALILKQLGLNKDSAKKFLKDWKTSNKIIDNTILTTNLLAEINTASNYLLYLTGKENIENAILVNSVFAPNADLKQLIYRYENLQIKSKHDLQISGSDLIKKGIIKPGPKLGMVLSNIEEMVVNDELKNDPQILLSAAQKSETKE